MKRVYCLTDLDGTLLRPDRSVSEATIRVLGDVQEFGHVISFATARSPLTARTLVGHVPWQYPALVYNGAVLVDPKTARVMEGRFLPNDIAEEVAALGRRAGLSPLVDVVGSNDAERVDYETPKHEVESRYLRREGNQSWFRHVKKFAPRADDRVVFVNFLGTKSILHPLLLQLQAQLQDEAHIQLNPDAYDDEMCFLSVGHILGNKGDGVQMWCNTVGCSIGDLTVIGDSVNDVPMFSRAGTALAVANAHPEARRAATASIKANIHDGVADYLARACGVVSNRRHMPNEG